MHYSFIYIHIHMHIEHLDLSLSRADTLIAWKPRYITLFNRQGTYNVIRKLPAAHTPIVQG